MEKHRPAPLRLKELVFPKVCVEALVPTSDLDGIARTLDLDATEISFLYQRDDSQDTVAVGMRLQTPPVPDGEPNDKQLYSLDLEAYAVFDVVGSQHRDDMAEYLRKVAAASALLGAIREQVSMTTARGPWGPLTIPLVGMDVIVGRPPATRKQEALAKEQAVASGAAKPRRTRKKTTEG